MAYDVLRTDEFVAWVTNLKDDVAKARIATRLGRLQAGNMGDAKVLGGGLSELKIDYGPGYRVYFVRRGRTVLLLLCGGDKRTQDADIARARKLAAEYE